MGAFEAMGAGRTYAFMAAVLPQVLPAYLSTCQFCLEGNVRYAAILAVWAPGATPCTPKAYFSGKSIWIWPT